VFREYIKLPTFKNIKRLKKNHLETQMNAQNNKRQNLSRKIVAAWQIFSRPLNMSGIFSDFFTYIG
jgi:hypothetical protein